MTTPRHKASLEAARRARETPEQAEARRAYQRAYQRKKYYARRAAGECVTCRAQTSATYCEPCTPRVVRVVR